MPAWRRRARAKLAAASRVVAAEVRALALRSAEAAKEIKALISNSAAQVGDGVKLVDATGSTLTQISGQVTGINALMIEVAASAQSQAAGLREVNLAISDMDKVTQQNAAMAEQSSAACLAAALPLVYPIRVDRVRPRG